MAFAGYSPTPHSTTPQFEIRGFAPRDQRVAEKRRLFAARAAEVFLVPRVLVGAARADLGDEVAPRDRVRAVQVADSLDQALPDRVQQRDPLHARRLAGNRRVRVRREAQRRRASTVAGHVGPCAADQMVEERLLPVVRGPEAHLVAPDQRAGLHRLVELARAGRGTRTRPRRRRRPWSGRTWGYCCRRRSSSRSRTAARTRASRRPRRSTAAPGRWRRPGTPAPTGGIPR